MFDEILQGVLGGDQTATRNQSAGLLEGLMDMLGDDRAGGLQGFANQLQGQGLGDVVSSWIGTGQNRAISPDQIVAALGRARVDALSQRAGIPAALGAGAIAAVIPALIDKLTPDGRVPERSALGTIGKGILAAAAAGLAARAAASVFGGRDAQAGSAPAAPAAPPDQPVRTGFTFQPAGDDAPIEEPRPAAAARGAERTYTVVAGDNLSQIAKRLLGDANAWPRILEANRDQIENANLIRPGQVLRIPS
jgi:uncharacterized protein YidB (DUF937 family)